MNKYCLIICVLNEGERFRTQVQNLAKYSKLVDIIVVDGGSNDGSTEKPFLKKHHIYHLIRKSSINGLSAQLQAGFKYALQNQYSGIICMDGNAKDDTKSIPDFIKKLESGYDFVQGSRFLPNGQYLNTPIDRLLGIWLVQVPIIRLASKYPYTDPANGFKAFSLKLLSDNRLAIFRPIFTGYSLQYYLTVNAPRLGYKTCEIPVIRNYPSKGPVPTKINTWSKKLSVLKDFFLAANGHLLPERYGLIDIFLRRVRENEVIKQLRHIPFSALVDVGCGLEAHFSTRVKKFNIQYSGVDVLVPPFIDAHEFHKFFPRGHFDTIISLANIEHLDNPHKFLMSAYQAAKPKGFLIITTPTSPYSPLLLKALGWLKIVNKQLFSDHKHCFSQPDMEQILYKSGWKLHSSRTFLFGLNSIYIAQKT